MGSFTCQFGYCVGHVCRCILGVCYSAISQDRVTAPSLFGTDVHWCSRLIRCSTSGHNIAKYPSECVRRSNSVISTMSHTQTHKRIAVPTDYRSNTWNVLTVLLCGLHPVSTVCTYVQCGCMQMYRPTAMHPLYYSVPFLVLLMLQDPSRSPKIPGLSVK